MNFFIRLRKALGIFLYYYVRPNPARLGYFGKNASLGIPADLKNPRNIYLYDHARIGRRSTIMTMGESRFVMKRESGAAEGLTVITSNHKQRLGEFRTGGNDDNTYRDIIVEEDVWIGINVTLLSGAYIGRGAIIGAGAVVRTFIPPYSIVVGNPAIVVGFKWSVVDIMRHEQALYPEEERLSQEIIENYINKYTSNNISVH